MRETAAAAASEMKFSGFPCHPLALTHTCGESPWQPRKSARTCSLSWDELVTCNLMRLPVNWLNTIQEEAREIPGGTEPHLQGDESQRCLGTVLNRTDTWSRGRNVLPIILVDGELLNGRNDLVTSGETEAGGHYPLCNNPTSPGLWFFRSQLK